MALLLSAAGAWLVWQGARRGGRALRWAGLALLAAAFARLLIWESYPDLTGGTMAPLWLRLPSYLVTIAATYTAAWSYQKHRGDRRLMWALLAAANFLTVWYLTFEATYAIDGRDHGRLAGNEGLLVAAVWSLYGLGLALAERRLPHEYLRNASRAMLGAGLIFLLGGALPANARWADPAYRFGSYAAVIGSAWLAEARFARAGDDSDVQGMPSLVALVTGALVLAFELKLWLNHIYTFPLGMLRSAESLATEASVRTFWTVTAWGIYALSAAAAGVLLRSARTRLVAFGLFGLALAYGAFGTLQLLAPWPLQAAAMAAAAGGAVAAVLLARRAPGERHPREPLAGRVLVCGALAVLVEWAVKLWVK